MKFRGLLIAAVVLAALAGGVYWSNKAKKAAEGKPSSDAAPKLVEIPEDQIQKIEIKKAAGVTKSPALAAVREGACPLNLFILARVTSRSKVPSPLARN